MTTYPVNSTGHVAWLDWLKGVAIFLVVLGHSLIGQDEASALWLFLGIYSFHMPLFFVLTGLVAAISMTKTSNPWVFLKKRLITILLPYFVWCFFRPLLFTSCDSLVYNVSSQWDTFVTGNVYLWFLPCLLMLHVLFTLYSNIQQRCHSVFLHIAALFTLFVITFFLHRFLGKTLDGQTDKLEWITNAYVFFPSYFFGVLLIQWSRLYQWVSENEWLLLAAILISLFLVVNLSELPYQNYLKQICGISVSIVLIRLMLVWKEGTFWKKQLALLGRNTLIIYFVSGLLEAKGMQLFVPGMNATFVLLAYSIASLFVCYLCVLIGKIFELSSILSFLLLGSSRSTARQNKIRN